MFCPQCGQQQVSPDVRFCSRCGFQLAAVSGLLTSGGIPTQSQSQTSASRESPRRRGVRQGTLMFLLGLVLTPVMAILTEQGRGPDGDFPEVLIPLTAVIFIFGGFLRMLYALIFEEGPLRRRPAPHEQTLPGYAPPAQGQLNYMGRDAASLPPAQSMPAQHYAPPRPAAEMAPPSVTEHTTRLLQDQPERKE